MNDIPYIPARMLNGFVFCPRLGYLMWVQGEFAHSADTLDGVRKIYKTLLGYGDWLQLFVFQCRLSRKRLVQMEALLSDYLNHREDHLLILDLGPADVVKPHVRSIGKAFVPVTREPVIV